MVDSNKINQIGQAPLDKDSPAGNDEAQYSIFFSLIALLSTTY